MTSPDTDPEESSMPLVAHLIELRNRLLKAILAILAIFLVLYPLRTSSMPGCPAPCAPICRKAPP